jgi:phospholipase C
VGLGFRTPCLVISPFSRGGYRYSGVLDHTSVLRFIEARFGVKVPNLSAWRRGVTGDMTGALALSQAPNTAVPALPATSLGDTSVAEQAVLNALADTLDVGIPYRCRRATRCRPRRPRHRGRPCRPECYD